MVKKIQLNSNMIDIVVFGWEKKSNSYIHMLKMYRKKWEHRMFYATFSNNKSQFKKSIFNWTRLWTDRWSKNICMNAAVATDPSMFVFYWNAHFTSTTNWIRILLWNEAFSMHIEQSLVLLIFFRFQCDQR